MTLQKSTYKTERGTEFEIEYEKHPPSVNNTEGILNKRVTIYAKNHQDKFKFNHSSPETVKLIGEELLLISKFVEEL